MKLSNFLIGLLFLLFACDKDESPQLTPNLVDETKSYDLGNNGNASDIRVDFSVNDNINVTEYRVMILPATNTIDVSIAQSLPQSSYFSITPGTLFDYSVNRLPSELLDINRNSVTNGNTYVVTVLVVGTDNAQISQGGFSKEIELADQGIYSGRYIPTWGGTCISPNGDTVSVSPSPIENVTAFVDFTENMNVYSGIMRCPTCFQRSRGDIELTVNGSNISNYIRTWPGKLCAHSPECEDVGLEYRVDPCPIIEQGEGTIVDEVTFVIPGSRKDCLAECLATRYYTRVG